MEVLRGDTAQWSHREQKASDQKVLRGVGTHWSHKHEQSRGDREVVRGVRTHCMVAPRTKRRRPGSGERIFTGHT